MSDPETVHRFALALVVVGVLAVPATASASQLIDRNASRISLQVNARGQALLTYRDGGRLRHVLAWGAVNAIAPTQARGQVAFRLDYSGGWGTYHRDVWKSFRNVCRPYDGPPLAWLVTACTAPDGSYWALQSWQRMLANYGGASAPWELHLSHWSGPLPVLSIVVDWAYRRFDHLFGTFTYRGSPVYGFRSTAGGRPLDTFGRNLYVDTRDSAYGPGWRRENSFLTHTGTGVFCYGFYPHGAHPIGKGTMYRATIIGPGVTPLVSWTGDAPGPFDDDLAAAAHAQLRALGDRQCRAV